MSTLRTIASSPPQGPAFTAASARIPYLDALKVTSCFLIILLHAVGPWAVKVDYALEWFTATAFSAATRCAVPCFIMSSGVLMLSQDTGDLLQFYRKGLIRYGLPLAVALVYYKAKTVLRTDDSEWLKGLVYDIPSNPGYHLWYVWMWLGLLAATPVFRQICKDRTSLKIYLVLGLMYSVFSPTLGRFGFSIPIFNTIVIDYGFYYVLGYWLSTAAPRLKLRSLYIAAALSLAGIIATTYVSSLSLGKLDEFYFALPALPVLIYSASVFLLFKGAFNKELTIITRVSRSTFGIYLLHILVLSLVTSLVSPSHKFSGLLLTIFVVSPAAFFLGWVISRVVRDIPILRHLIP